MARSGIRQALGVAAAAWRWWPSSRARPRTPTRPRATRRRRGDSATATELATGEPMDLSVLTYNIEYSGNKHTDAVIEDIDADVVGRPRVLRPASRDRREDGLPLLQPRPPAALEVPHPRALRSRRPLRPDRGAAGLRRGDVQHPPRLREVRAAAPPQRDAGRRGAGLRGRGTHRLDRGADPRRGDAARRGVPGLPHRRPQPALEPRLHRGDHRDARGRRRGRAVDGQRGAAGRRPARLVPRDPPRPRRGPRHHPRQPRLPVGGGFGDRIDYLYAGGPAVTQTSELVGEVGGPERGPRVRPVDLRPPRRAVDVRRDTRRPAPDAVPGTPAAHRGRGARRPLQRAGQHGQHHRGRSRGRVGRRGAGLRARREEAGETSFDTTVARAVRLRHRPGGRRGRGARAQLVLGALGGGGRRAGDRQDDVRRRRADRGHLGRRPREPMGLDRRLRGRRGQPREGRLPALGLHRRPRGRRPAADRVRRHDHGAGLAGEALAAASRRLPHPLPARRPVRLRRVRRGEGR